MTAGERIRCEKFIAEFPSKPDLGEAAGACVSQLKSRLIEDWEYFHQVFIDEAIRQWRYLVMFDMLYRRCVYGVAYSGHFCFGSTAGIFHTQRPKIRFFVLQGRLFAQIHVIFGIAERHVGSRQ